MTEFTITCDKNATIYAEEELLVQADKQTVMSLLTNLNNWTSWRKDIQNVTILQADIQEGSHFKWRSAGIGYHSIIHTMNDSSFGWTGKTFGARAVHNWTVEAVAEHQTRVYVQECLEGWLMKLFKKNMAKELPKLLQKDLKELKDACESVKL